MTFAVRFKAKLRRSAAPGHPVVTRRGAEHWVIVDMEGWVPATSQAVQQGKEPPLWLKVWRTRDEAEAFMGDWEGHPWYAVPSSYEIVEVEPRYENEPKLVGYEEVKS